MMDSALAHGINFFDTANVYGRHLGVGATEEIIGRWFAKGSGRRDKVVLATKVYGTMGDWPNEARLSKLAIRKACEASLKRLQTDHIDLYQMHHIDRERLVGRDLGGHRAAEARGQDPLRRIVELRRLAHRPRERDRELAPLPRARLRAVALQPHRPHDRARGDPGDPGVRHGPDPVEPARGRAAGRRAREGREGMAPFSGVHGRRDRGRTATSSTSGRRSATSWASGPPTSRSPGSCTNRR